MVQLVLEGYRSYLHEEILDCISVEFLLYGSYIAVEASFKQSCRTWDATDHVYVDSLSKVMVFT